MPNPPKVRVVTTVPFDDLIKAYEADITKFAFEQVGLPVPEAGTEYSTKMTKGKNGVKVVITID